FFIWSDGTSCWRRKLARPDLEKGIVRFLFGDGREWAVTGANQCWRRQGKDLFANLLFRQVPGLIAGAHRAGENRVTHDGHMGSIIRPCADNVSYPVLGMAGCFA